MQDATAASVRNNRCERKTRPLRVQEKHATCFEKRRYMFWKNMLRNLWKACSKRNTALAETCHMPHIPKENEFCINSSALHIPTTTHYITAHYKYEELLQLFIALHSSSCRPSQQPILFDQGVISWHEEAWRLMKSQINSSCPYLSVYPSFTNKIWRTEEWEQNSLSVAPLTQWWRGGTGGRTGGCNPKRRDGVLVFLWVQIAS